MTYSVTIKGKDLESLKVLEKTARELGLETEEACTLDTLEIELEAPMNEAARCFLASIKKYPPRRIPNDHDVNDIFDEVNNNEYMFETKKVS